MSVTKRPNTVNVPRLGDEVVARILLMLRDGLVISKGVNDYLKRVTLSCEGTEFKSELDNAREQIKKFPDARFTVRLTPPNNWLDSSNGNVGRNLRKLSFYIRMWSNNVNVELTLPGDIDIPPYAFYGCKRLHKIIFEESPVSITIGKRAFTGCTDLYMVSLPRNVILNEAFDSCEIKNLVIICDHSTLHFNLSFNNSKIAKMYIEQRGGRISINDSFCKCRIDTFEANQIDGIMNFSGAFFHSTIRHAVTTQQIYQRLMDIVGLTVEDSIVM